MKAPATSNEIEISVQAARLRYADKAIRYDRALNAAAKVKRKDPLILWLLSLEGHRDLSNPEIVRVISEAATRNDHLFFTRLAKVLETKPRGDEYEKNKAAEHLIDNWFKPDAEVSLRGGKSFQISHPIELGFCHWNDPTLAAYFQSRGNPNINSKSIRKTWERLGLKKGRILVNMARDIRGWYAASGK